MTQEPSSRFTETQIVEWLVDECRDVADRVTTVATSGDRVFTAGVTVMAIAVTVAIGGGKGYLLMWFPFAVSVVLLHALYLKRIARSLIGYQLGLEKEIARRAGLPLIAWQSHVQQSGRPHRQAKVLLLTAVFVYVASAVIGLAQALRTTSPGAWGHERAWLYIMLTVVNVAGSAVLIGCSHVSQLGATRTAEKRVEDAFAAAVRPAAG